MREPSGGRARAGVWFACCATSRARHSARVLASHSYPHRRTPLMPRQSSGKTTPMRGIVRGLAGPSVPYHIPGGTLQRSIIRLLFAFSQIVTVSCTRYRVAPRLYTSSSRLRENTVKVNIYFSMYMKINTCTKIDCGKSREIHRCPQTYLFRYVRSLTLIIA